MSIIVGEGFEFESHGDAFVGMVPDSIATAFTLLFITPASARKMGRALFSHALNMEDDGRGMSEDDANHRRAVEAW